MSILSEISRVWIFPLPILGVLLLFKAIALIALIRDTAHLQKQ